MIRERGNINRHVRLLREVETSFQVERCALEAVAD
jgi:hypothetical protein